MPAKITLKDPKEFTLIGTPAKRLDTSAKVNGTAQYGIDVRLPGMKIATVAASPVVGGKLASLDDTKAKAIKGVRQIVRLDDAVAVVADHMWAAKQGLKALDIRWDDGPNGTVSTADVVQGLAAAAQTPGVVVRNEGDAAAAVAGAPRKLESEYEVPFLAHATMEPMNCTVHVRPDGCEVWTGSQVLSRVRATAAEVTGLALEKVVVHNHLLGGGFGRRLEFDYVTQAVRIAKQVDGPVKVIWTREEDVQHDFYRPYYYDRVAAGVDARGQPIAWTHRLVGPAIIARWGSRASSTSLPQPRSRIPSSIGARCSASRRGRGQCWTSRRRQPVGAGRCLPAAVAASRFFTAVGAAIWRRSPRWRCRRPARCACTASSARSTAASSSTRTP